MNLLDRVPGPVIRFGQAPRGRVTGWAVACSEHGPMPVLAPSRAAAKVAAAKHRKHEHGELGRIVEAKGRRS